MYEPYLQDTVLGHQLTCRPDVKL